MVRALSDLGRDAEAGDRLRAALSADPGFTPAHASAHFTLGPAPAATGRPAEAERAFRRALRLRPDDVDAARALAEFLGAVGEPGEAAFEYREALRRSPHAPRPSAGLAAPAAAARRAAGPLVAPRPAAAGAR